MDDEERKQEQSPDLVGTAQNIQRAARLISKGAKVARAAMALAATSEIWVPIVVVGVFIFTFVIVLGGPGATSEISSQQQQEEKIAQEGDTSKLFTITARGDSVSDIYFYNDILGEAFSSSRYTELITKNGPFSVELDEILGEEENICARAYVLKPSTIKLFGFSRCSLGDQKYLALHESGHVIGNRNVELYKSFPHSELINNDSDCYSSLGHIKSYYYAETERGDIAAYNESFAEAIAMYIIRKKSPFADFRLKCPYTSAWVAKNIFNEK